MQMCVLDVVMALVALVRARFCERENAVFEVNFPRGRGVAIRRPTMPNGSEMIRTVAARAELRCSNLRLWGSAGLATSESAYYNLPPGRNAFSHPYLFRLSRFSGYHNVRRVLPYRPRKFGSPVWIINASGLYPVKQG
jgi:hypothetical protein